MSDHMIPALSEECAWVSPPALLKKKTLMPHIIASTLSAPLPLHMCSDAEGGERVVVQSRGGTDSGVFDLKVTSPLQVLRDPWRMRLTLI